MKFSSLKIKLILVFLVVGIIPALFVGYLSISAIKTNSTAISQSHVTGLAGINVIADLKKERLESFLIERKADLDIIRSRNVIVDSLPILEKYRDDINNPARLSVVQTLNTQLSRFLQAYHYDDVMLLDVNGVVIYTNNKEHRLLELNRQLTDITNTVVREGKNGVFLSQIMPDPITKGNFEFMVSGPVYDVNGKMLGIVVFQIDAENLYSFVGNRTGLGDSGEIFLVKLNETKDGAVVTSPLRFESDAILNKVIKFGDENALDAQFAAQEKNEGSGEVVDYRGAMVLAAWRHIHDMEWGLVVKIDEAEALEAITNMQKTTWLVVSLLVLLSIGISLIMAYSITRPIEKLTRIANDISRGNLSVKVESLSNQDEIGDLARAFDRTIISLKLAMRENKKTEHTSLPIMDQTNLENRDT